MERALAASGLVLGIVICVIGVAMVATTIARGGGPISFGVVVGVLFTVAGAGRLYVAGVRLPGRSR
ncbi:MAG TPA: hypothetical protein VEX39_02975 [Thermoleophilaceae bacterium]|nr:hypothetical protein [Thermoleophilaceae bacterium]